jgi:hypothetical protein
LGEFKIPLNQRSVYGESELHCFIAKVLETDENEKIFESADSKRRKRGGEVT